MPRGDRFIPKMADFLAECCQVSESSIYLDYKSIESMVLCMLHNFPMKTVWYLQSGEATTQFCKFAEDNVIVDGCPGFSSFLGYERSHLYRVNQFVLQSLNFESKHYVNVVVEEDETVPKLQHVHPVIFFRPCLVSSATFHNLPPNHLRTDHIAAMVTNHKFKMVKSRNGTLHDPFDLPKLCWEENPQGWPTPKKDSLDEVLAKLYDVAYRRSKAHDVPRLLGRYKELTGKDRPAFM